MSEGSNRRPVRRLLVATATVGLLAFMLLPLVGQAAPNTLFFKETGFSISGPLLDYWRANGQLTLLGYPIAASKQANGQTVQYFERARLELTGSKVTLGLLGRELTAGQSFVKVAAFKNKSDSVYFKETGHSLNRRFLEFWKANGGLTRFGYPLSEPHDSNGKVIQWFERARFEWDSKREKVVLGLLGRESLYPTSTLKLATAPQAANNTVATPEPTTATVAARPTSAPSRSAKPKKWETDPVIIGTKWTGWCTYFSTDWANLIRLNKGWGNLPTDYKGEGIYAAIPEDITEKYRLYGHWVRISYKGKSVDAQLTDVIAYRDIAQVRARGIVVDLSRQAFAALENPSKGMMVVTVEILPL